MRGGRLIKERTNERRWRRCIRLIKLRQSTGHEELIGQGQRDQERLRAVANTLGPALRLASNRHGAQPLHDTTRHAIPIQEMIPLPSPQGRRTRRGLRIACCRRQRPMATPRTDGGQPYPPPATPAGTIIISPKTVSGRTTDNDSVVGSVAAAPRTKAV